MNVFATIEMMREELASVEEDDKELAGEDWHEDAVSEAWRNGYARALQVVYEEYTKKCCE
jgi:hypothetical protein